MSNIYMKLSKASQSADKVIKSPKKGGMFFNALEHDEVQKVAMAALNEHGLYPVCNYENIISDRNVFIKCEMFILNNKILCKEKFHEKTYHKQNEPL